MAKNKYRNDDVFYISDLRVLIYVIGYARYGESSVFLILNGDTVCYSVVIDSYHYRRNKKEPYINKAMNILDKHHVKHLDVLCWTHPHDDHSKGLTTLLGSDYCDEDTEILYPMYIEDNEADILKLKKVSTEAVRKILTVNRDGKGKANPIGVVEGKFNNIDAFKIVNSFDMDDIRDVSLDVITPISRKLTSYVNDKKCTDPNELSITLIVNIDGYGFYFGGDTTNEHIDASNKNMIGQCRFVKIPHHSSDTALHLLDYLPVDRLDAVCTTVFKWGRSKLPKPMVIKEYQKYFTDVYSTNKDLRQKGCGTVKYEFNFNYGFPSCSVHKNGNVGKLDLVP